MLSRFRRLLAVVMALLLTLSFSVAWAAEFNADSYARAAQSLPHGNYMELAKCLGMNPQDMRIAALDWLVGGAYPMNVWGARSGHGLAQCHLGEMDAMLYENRLPTAPVAREFVPHGRAQTPGFPSLPEAMRIARTLNAGEMPAAYRVMTRD